MGSGRTWLSLLNRGCWNDLVKAHALWCHAEALVSLASQPRADLHTLFKIHTTHMHALFLSLVKHKQSSYLTAALSEVAHLKPGERERNQTQTRAHTGQSCQTSWYSLGQHARKHNDLSLVHACTHSRALANSQNRRTGLCKGSHQQMQWMIDWGDLG